MTVLKKSLLTAVLTAASAGVTHAQDTGSNTSAVGGSSLGSSSSSGGGTAQPSNPTGFVAPTISAQDTTNGFTGNSFLQPSNILGGYFANPSYAGRAGAALNTLPGGFGNALYQPSLGSAGGGFGSSGSNAFTAAAGASPVSSLSGFGGNTGTNGGFNTAGRGLGTTGQTGGNQGFGRNTGGFGGGQSAGGVVIAAPGPIAYTATLRFAAPAPTAQQVATDLRGVLDRSSMLTNPKTIDLFTNGSKVVLRGTVPNAQESETAEGMVRLTPGVFEVVNELQVAAVPTPVPAPPAP